MKRILLVWLGLFAAGWLSATEKLSLDQCVQEALRNNKTILQGEIDLKQKKISTQSAYSNWYPAISLSGSEGGQIKDTWNSRWNTEVGVRQNLYSPGMYSEVKLAKIDEDIARIDQNELAAQIRSRVETAYYDILTSQALIAVYRENILAADENLHKIQTMFKLGTRTESDVLKAEVQKGDFESALINEEFNLDNQKRNLNLLRGCSPDQEFTLEDVNLDLISIPSLEEAKAMVLQNNREYLSLQKSLKADQISFHIAKESYLPTVSASYGYSKSESGVGSSSLGISTGLSLFDGFRKNQNVQKSKLNIKKANIQIQAKEQELLSTVLQYYSGLDNYNKTIALQEKNLESARKDYELVTRQYELGLGTILDQTNAQLSVLKAQSNLVKAKYSRKIVESQIIQLLAI